MTHRPLSAALLLRRQLSLALLVFALLWAQLLGLAHGVRHLAPLAHDTHAAAAHGAPASLLDHLQDSAGDEGECRLYDQLGHGGPALQRLAASVAALPLVPTWVVLQALLPRPCVSFAARAPPLSR